MVPSQWSWPPTPIVPIPACPYPQTFNQQLEGPGATKEGDHGRIGLAYVGARRIEGDGAE